jgi:protein-disulfide isomerase
MLIQVISLMGTRSDARDRALIVLGTLAMAGALNAVYHHRGYERVANDPQELFSYLISKRPGAVSFDEVIQERRTAVQKLRTDQAVSPVVQREASLPGDDRQKSDQSGISSPEQHSSKILTPSTHMRDAALASTWGSPSAPLRLKALMDPTCPRCDQEFGDLLELKDFVDQGQLVIDFKVRFETPIGNAATTVFYGAGLIGEKELLDVGMTIFDVEHPIKDNQDLLRRLKDRIDLDHLITIVEKRDSELQALVGAAQQLALDRGVQGNPHLWLTDNQTDDVLVYWPGRSPESNVAALRRGITNHLQSPPTHSGSKP